VARSFLSWQRDRFPDLVSSHTEVPASLELQSGIRITGIADRIDIRGPNSADILDYKTGSSPSLKEARILLDPQLALEAAALKRGAFKGIPALVPESLIYVRLRPGTKFKTECVNNEFSKASAKTVIKTADDLAADSVRELEKLVGVLKSGSKGFMSRLIPVRQGDRSGDYDHLARVAEWATADGDEEDSFGD
jgi:ATP-dependent helicase/nuclease subunit B